MIKAVLLDADGVVIKKHGYFSDRYKNDFGKSLNDDVVSGFFRNDYQKAAVGKADLKELLKNRLNEWGWDKSIDELLEYWFEGERDLDEEVLEVANMLRGKGVKTCLASDNEKYRAGYLLNKAGLKDHFDEIFFSCYLGYTKSDPGFFKAIFKKLNLKPEEIRYFDDDRKNIDVACALGINAFLYESADQIKNQLSFPE